jgi:hypothetical protein
VIYVVVAYAFGVVTLGGFLVLSLRHLRELSAKAPEKK